jgi:hypothetical protein
MALKTILFNDLGIRMIAVFLIDQGLDFLVAFQAFFVGYLIA